MRRVWWASLIFLPVIGILLTIYSFWQPSQIESLSVAYFLKVPRSVREFPVWQPVNEPLYRVRIADGEKRSFVGLRYVTGLDQNTLRNLIKSQLLNCEEDICRKNNEDGTSIELSYLPSERGNGLQVDVGFFDY